MNRGSLTFRQLTFTGPTVRPAALRFGEGLNLFWGASNTGKSFALKSLDFMLGGNAALPDIRERKGYSKIWLGIALAGFGDFTISRAVAGGPYQIFEGIHTEKPDGVAPLEVAAKHVKGSESLSGFLLERLGFDGCVIAKDAWGTKQSVTLRQIAHLLLVDETTIQAERSPVWRGQHSERTFENGVFRMLLTGHDDSDLVSVTPAGKTRAEKATKLELLDQMIADIDVRLDGQPSEDALRAQDAKIATQLRQIEAEIEHLQSSVQHLIDEKREVMTSLTWVETRIDEIRVHAERFRQLDAVYVSDVERLEALEEAGFLLTSYADHDCPLCGAPAGAQTIQTSLGDVETVREAAVAEVGKVVSLRSDLSRTLADLDSELTGQLEELPRLKHRLGEIEQLVAAQLPTSGEYERRLRDLLAARDQVHDLLGAYDQRSGLMLRHARVFGTQAATKQDKPSLELPRSEAQDFANVVLEVLKSWGFPASTVSFDAASYDVDIDGKPRINNGKGVRAVTHSAFKVALLMYCRSRGLPHPGFLVLDTPLLTYRDPIKNPRFGDLTDDEKALAATPVRQRFFEHLHSLAALGQFVVFENVDPPANVAELATVEVFSGQEEGRRGFFPV